MTFAVSPNIVAAILGFNKFIHVLYLYQIVSYFVFSFLIKIDLKIFDQINENWFSFCNIFGKTNNNYFIANFNIRNLTINVLCSVAFREYYHSV